MNPMTVKDLINELPLKIIFVEASPIVSICMKFQFSVYMLITSLLFKYIYIYTYICKEVIDVSLSQVYDGNYGRVTYIVTI